MCAKATMHLASCNNEFESIVHLARKEENKKERNKESIQLFSLVFQVQIVV
jgi:hypothetical protein